MIRVSAIRFFHVVSPVPGYLRIAMASAAVLGAWMLWLNAGEVDSALGSVLLLQMFAVSNGYAAAARRGWFDSLLVSGRGGPGAPYASLAAAAWPGIAVWLLLALIEAAARHGGWPSALTLHRLAALAMITAGAWTAGLKLPRMGGATLWVAVLLVLASTRALLPQMTSLQSSPRLPIHAAADALACIVCPFLLLADYPGVRDPIVTLCVLCVAAVCVAGGAAWVSRRGVPLGCAS